MKNLILLAFLYFIQGIPYGLQARFLPIYLRTQGMSLTNLGLFKLLLLPWMCKALWAPFVDRLGTKKSWLTWSLVAMVFTCAVGSLLDPSNISSVSIMMFVLNCATSTQDIAVDGLAIGILSSSELAQGNIAQVVGYKIGAVVGGGVFLWLSSYITWSTLFSLLTGTYLLAIFIVNQFVDRSDVTIQTIEVKLQENKSNGAILKESNHHEHGCSDRSTFLSVQISKHFTDVFTTQGTVWICLYVLLYKLGETSALNMLPLFLVDRGVSSSQVGFWAGVVGQWFSISGSVVGGWLISYYRYTTVGVTRTFCSVRVILILLQVLIIAGWSQATLSSSSALVCAVLSMSGLLFVSGLVTTTTFTMMMQCSQHAPVTVQASHYTTLATLEVMGKLLFSAVTGTITDLFGYTFSFCLFTVLSVIVLPLFLFCPAVVKQPPISKNH